MAEEILQDLQLFPFNVHGINAQGQKRWLAGEGLGQLLKAQIFKIVLTKIQVDQPVTLFEPWRQDLHRVVWQSCVVQCQHLQRLVSSFVQFISAEHVSHCG